MHEKKKISEATYFYRRMITEQEDPKAFHYNLSAFLSAARSALQYANEEVRGQGPAQQWYDTQVSNNSVLKFFKDKRDINIHSEPVEATKAVNVSIPETVTISESVRIIIRREDGSEEVRESSPEPGQAQRQRGQDSSVLIRYYFTDWPGDENVLALCGAYLENVKRVIEGGISNGFLSD